MSPTRDDQAITVLQFGNDARSVRGGIAAVIRQHLANPDDRLSVLGVPTYDPSGVSHWRRNAPYLRALGRALRGGSGRPVVAHVHLSQGGSLVREGLLTILLRLRCIPVVVTLHGSSSLTRRGLSFLVTGLVLRSADVAHFLSEAHRVRYASLVGNHVTVPNSVVVGSGTEESRGQDVVFAGVVGARKGADVLLKAWESVSSAGWRLHLYGPLDDDFSLPGEVPGVVVHGEVEPDEVQKALASASLAVLPSREEAFPMFLLEAMARRCAVVATDVGGVEELMGDTGLLVPAGDVGALAEALARLMSQPDLRAVLADSAGRRAAERFDADVVAQAWADTYVSLTGTPSGGGAARA